MKALMKTQRGPGNVELVDISDPQPGYGEVKIEVKAAAVCGTDIHILNDRFINFPPVVLGHEIAGQVLSVGEGVDRFKSGDRVTINPGAGRTCGYCIHCRAGYYMFCKQREGIGSRLNGGFAKYIVVREEIVYRLPEKINFETGALCEPLACAVQAALELTDVCAGDVVFISGPGLMGLLTTQLALAEGGKVVICGLPDDEERLKLAQQLGAHHTVTVGKDDIRGLVEDLSDGNGANISFECAGTEGSLKQCLEVVGPRGRVTQIGVMSEAVTIDFNQIFYKQLQIQGSFAANWRSWERALRLLSQDRIDLKPLISAQLSLADWKEAFANLQKRVGVRTILYPLN